MAVLAQSCDSTGALKPRRRGCFCGACNRTTGQQDNRTAACVCVCLRVQGWPPWGNSGRTDRIMAAGVGGWARCVPTWTRRLCARFKLGSIIPALCASLPVTVAVYSKQQGANRLGCLHLCQAVTLPSIAVPKTRSVYSPGRSVIALGLLASDLQEAGCYAARYLGNQMWVAATS